MNRAKVAASQLAKYGCAQIWNPVGFSNVHNICVNDCRHNEPAEKARKDNEMSTLAPPQTSTTTWNIDPAHATAEFKVFYGVQRYVVRSMGGQLGRRETASDAT